jgi:hypothetical protein
MLELLSIGMRNERACMHQDFPWNVAYYLLFAPPDPALA